MLSIIPARQEKKFIFYLGRIEKTRRAVFFISFPSERENG